MNERIAVLHPRAAEQWSEVNRLLDEALALDEGKRTAWVASLPVTPARAVVERLLGQRARVESAKFLGTLPPLSPAALARIDGDSAARSPQAGDEIGPWRLLRELGHGGMGSVWLAERSDGTLKRQVALKLPHAAWHAGLAERMQRERDILATLEHTHIARLYDAGVDALGRPWLALEYVQGRPIDEFVKAEACDMRTRIGLVVQVAQAVAYAHTRLVIHRDLKPSNILVSGDGQVHLLDFGIAKLMQGERTEETALTQEAGRALTPEYASPEQLRGDPLTTASDVYSLGVVAYGLLAGARPYRLPRGTVAELEAAIASVVPPLASDAATDAAARKALRGDLDAILNKALKKSPGERYATVDAMVQDLARHLAGEKVAARPDSLAYRARRLVAQQRRPLIAGVALTAAFGLALGAGATALVIAALALGLAAALWQARRAEVKAREAREQATRAQAVQQFVLDIFHANTDRQPGVAKARQASARDLLDRGAARVETALAGAPEARIEVTEMLVRMYYQLMHFEQAAALQRRQVALVRQVRGERDRQVADELMALANLLFHTAPSHMILPHLHEAQAILDAIGEPETSVMRGQLLLSLAKNHVKVSLAAMRGYADEAVRILAAGPMARSTHMSTALQMGAVARLDLGDPEGAAPLLQRALTTLNSLPAVPQIPVYQVRSTLCECMAAQHRYGEVLDLARRTHEDARATLGELDPGVLLVAAKLGHWLHITGQREEGRTVLRSALDSLEQAGADAGLYFLAQARRLQGRVDLAEGRVSDALAQLETAVASLRDQFSGTVWLAAALHELALAAAAVGDSDQAASCFEEGLTVWRKLTGGEPHNWRVNRFLVDRARFDLDHGCVAAAALSRLEGCAPMPTVALPAEALERDLLMSRARLAVGDTEAALALASSAAAAVHRSPAEREMPELWVETQLQLARALLASGHCAEALPAAQRAADWRRLNDAADSPWTAEAERVLAECLLELGRRDDAQAAARQAAARHAAHARLAAHLRDPLRELLVRLDQAKLTAPP